ncbi:GNAT family N-acetyltransferase [Streptomyces sp. TRM49041]|uniref:GNAT family N-acetyltransferase n=1 Tax=Streptomyces sp. TRM49041 TaxID=2603216 RepID=UPI0011EF85FF|nr:GNAT family N-acetyltransferase [Streptomyces sp. TRM49041]
MTTTLRPTGPLQQHDDGSLARSYEVCVNSRPVGGVQLGTVRGQGRTVGTIRALHVEEADRGRGRGTVAALAAEEVLRGWRCDRIRISVPAGDDAAAARRLATALGYTEHGHILVKDLDGTAPEPPPPGLEILPMTEAESGRLRSADPHATRASLPEPPLPGGPATEDTALHVAVRDGVRLGHLLTGRRELAPGEWVPCVRQIAVTEAERHKGYRRALLHFAEQTARSSGARRLALRVAPDAAPPRTPYSALGYRPALIDYEKQLY